LPPSIDTATIGFSNLRSREDFLEFNAPPPCNRPARAVAVRKTPAKKKAATRYARLTLMANGSSLVAEDELDARLIREARQSDRGKARYSVNELHARPGSNLKLDTARNARGRITFVSSCAHRIGKNAEAVAPQRRVRPNPSLRLPLAIRLVRGTVPAATCGAGCLDSCGRCAVAAR
jgi:hypothetical protein